MDRTKTVNQAAGSFSLPSEMCDPSRTGRASRGTRYLTPPRQRKISRHIWTNSDRTLRRAFRGQINPANGRHPPHCYRVVVWSRVRQRLRDTHVAEGSLRPSRTVFLCGAHCGSGPLGRKWPSLWPSATRPPTGGGGPSFPAGGCLPYFGSSRRQGSRASTTGVMLCYSCSFT